uniref:Pentatricopeptide repeat-containing protein n=1 Tax=Glycine max TaxID=3847 RepID=K7MR95_SOYBN
MNNANCPKESLHSVSNGNLRWILSVFEVAVLQGIILTAILGVHLNCHLALTLMPSTSFAKWFGSTFWLITMQSLRFMGFFEIWVGFWIGALRSSWLTCDIDEAQALFDGVRVKDVSTYNSMIGGLALHRKSIEAVELFSEMLKERVRPNDGGLVDLGGEIFESMEMIHGIEPEVEHYGCIVDILSRVDYILQTNFTNEHVACPIMINKP